MRTTDRILDVGQIFRFPEVNQFVEETPPYFCWRKEADTKEYHIVVRKKDGTSVWDVKTTNTFTIPDYELPSGEYEWNLYTEQEEMGWVSFTIAQKAVPFLRPTAEDIFTKVPTMHPRHLFFQEDIEDIKKNKGAELEVLKRNIKLAIENGFPEPPVYHMPENKDSLLDYRAYFGKYRDYCDRDLIACALGHAILQDEEATEHGKKLLLTICNWNPEGPCSINGPWGDEVGLSNCRCLPAAYDLLWDVLDEKERLFVERTIFIYGKQCKENLLGFDFFSRPGRSHSGRVPAYLGEAAMILKGSSVVDEAELMEWLQLSVNIYGSFFPYYGGADGGWAEGTFYASTYTKWYLPFFMAVERLSGYRFLDRPFYQRVSQYFLHFSQPGMENHPFCDGYWCNSEDKEWPGFFAQNPFRFYADRFGPELAKEYAKKLELPEVFRLHLLDIFIPAGNPPEVHVTGEATNGYHFKEAGYISHHSNMEDLKHDTILLARASKFGSGSHQHADQGSFAIISGGTTLIGPSGYFGYKYGSEHHKNWTKQSKAHNCILVDGVGQKTFSHETIGKVLSCETLDDGTFVAELDLTMSYAMLEKWTRKFIKKDGTIRIIDDINSENEVEISWLLHSLSQPQVEDGQVVICRNDKKLEIKTMQGLEGTPEITDQFETNLFAGMEAKGDNAWFTLPNQYHMKWKTSRSKMHHIEVEFQI